MPGNGSDAAINSHFCKGFRGRGEPQLLIRALNGEFLNRRNSALSQKAPGAGYSQVPIAARLRRRLFMTTLTELNAMAALASTGLNIRPVNGYNAPAATGMPITL